MGRLALPLAAVVLSLALFAQGQLLLPGKAPEPVAPPPVVVQPTPAPVIKLNATAYNITPGGRDDYWLQVRPGLMEFRVFPWSKAPEYMAVQIYSVKEYRLNNSDVAGHQIEDLVKAMKGKTPAFSLNTDGKGASISYDLPDLLSWECPSAGVANGRRLHQARSLKDNKGQLTFTLRLSTASQDKQNYVTLTMDANWPFCGPNNTLRVAAAVYAPRALFPVVAVNKDATAFDGVKDVDVKVIQFNMSNGLLGTFIAPVKQRNSDFWALPGTNTISNSVSDLTFEFPNPDGDPFGYQMQIQLEGEYVDAPPPFPPPNPPPFSPPPNPPSPNPPPSPPAPKPSPPPPKPPNKPPASPPPVVVLQAASSSGVLLAPSLLLGAAMWAAFFHRL